MRSESGGLVAAPEKRLAPFWPLVVLLIAASLVYCLPLFGHLDFWGRQDWDQFTFRYATPRVALLRDHVLPTWNPYSRGGTALLAHPDSPVLSPWYLIVLLLDAPVGLRVQVALFMALGAVGMAAFLRRLGSGRAGCVVGGIVYMMSSHFALQITEGHLEWCVLGLMPWLGLCLLRMQESWRYVFMGALLLASVLTFGAVHIPAVYLPFLSLWMFFEALRRRQWKPLVRWGTLVLVAALLSSVKLLPTLEFTSKHPREISRGGWTSIALLPRMFGDPRQASYYKARRDQPLPEGHFAKALDSARAEPFLRFMDGAKMEWKFHEYACYIGVVGILLALVGALNTARRFWPLYGAGGVAMVVVMGATSPVDLWAALQHLPLYQQFRVPSRFLAAVLFVLSVAAAFGMGTVLNAMSGALRKWRAVAATMLPTLLYLELVAMGWGLFGDIFVAPPLRLGPFPSFAQRYGLEQGPYLYLEVMDSNMYACLLANAGTLDAYENLSVSMGAVRTVSDSQYRGEAYLQRAGSSVAIQDWTMSRLRIPVASAGPDTLILNQNFEFGWKVRRHDARGNLETVPAVRSHDGLLSVPVAGGNTNLEFFYLPRSFVLGAWISGLALVGCMVLLSRYRELFLR